MSHPPEDADLPLVITASRTADGAPVYLAAAGRWTTVLQEAALVSSAQEAEDLVRAAKSLERTISDPYPFPVRSGPGGLEPVSVREVIRGRGPTTPLRRPDR